MLTVTNYNSQRQNFQARVSLQNNNKLIKHPKLTASVISWCAGFSTACLMNRFVSGFFKII